jgi:hypothetical protein
VDPVPDPLLFFDSAGNRTQASGSVAKNSDHNIRKNTVAIDGARKDYAIIKLNSDLNFTVAEDP